jgi:hypothetical protein
MKKVLIVTLLVLSGCSTVNNLVDAYLMKYDPIEYKLIVDIRTISMLAKDKCDDVESSKKTANRLGALSLELMHFAEYQPHNKPVKESSVDLNNIVQGLKNQYNSDKPVSPVFCKIKFKSIEDTAIKIQQMEGSKPK